MIYTGCSMKVAISLLLAPSTSNFKNKQLLQKQFAWIVVKENKKTRVRTLNIWKLLYTGCSTKEVISLVLSQIMKNFKNEWPLYIHLWFLANRRKSKLKKYITKTVYILKLLHTGCSTKEVISLLLSQGTWNLKKNDFYKYNLGK